MRNWNLASANVWKYIGLVFTVPMRNWNEIVTGIEKHSIVCFYSTYEELKLNSDISNCNSAGGFYSTYEELKLFGL